MTDPENRPREAHDHPGRRDLLRAGALTVLGGGLADLAPRRSDAAGDAEGQRSDGGDRTIRLPAHYYQQFDADLAREVPAEGYGGWKQAPVELSRDHTALVVMHAWDTGTPEQFPGWHRAVEYIPRADRILREVFPPLLTAVRESGFPLLHVVGGGNYYQHLPGYLRSVTLAGPPPPKPARAEPDAALKELHNFRSANVFVGKHNEPDVAAGFAALALRRFDAAMANPPFFDDPGALRGPHPARAGAYLADDGLEAWATFLTAAVRDGGRITVIHRADRLADLLHTLGPRAGSFQVRPVQPFADAPAKRVLVRARRGGRGPGARAR